MLRKQKINMVTTSMMDRKEVEADRSNKKITEGMGPSINGADVAKML